MLSSRRRSSRRRRGLRSCSAAQGLSRSCPRAAHSIRCWSGEVTAVGRVGEAVAADAGMVSCFGPIVTVPVEPGSWETVSSCAHGVDTFGMRGDEEWAASGRFVASASGATPAISKRFRRYWWVLIAVFISPFVFYATTGRSLPGGGVAIPFACVVVVMLASLIPFLNWARHKNVLICDTGDGLTVDRRRGVVFSYSDAKLGLWNFGLYGGTTMGTALHLRNGRHRFVLGGKDHRIGAGTHLEASPVEYVDASMSASDFDALLSMIASRSGLDVRRPAPGEPTRCLLIPCPAWFFSDTLVGSFAAMSRPVRG